MFNVGSGEFLIILLVALVVLGPTRLPGALRQVGRFIGEAKKLSSNFQNEVQEAMADPVKKATGHELPKTAKDVVNKFGVQPPFSAQEATPKTAPTDAKKINGTSINGTSVEADATQHRSNGSSMPPHRPASAPRPPPAQPAAAGGVVVSGEVANAAVESAKPTVPTKTEKAKIPPAVGGYAPMGDIPLGVPDEPEDDGIDDIPMFGDR